jgi:hypothetical protein
MALFGKEYLTSLTEENARTMAHNATTGFSGIFGSIDCMHWLGRTAHLLGRDCTKVIPKRRRVQCDT